jgi:hypothetical protein
MKSVKLFFIIICCLIASGLFAQSPQAIEADLLKSFKKIDQLRPPGLYNQDTSKVSDLDSLGDANDTFGKKLLHYTSKYPVTIKQRFKSFDYTGLGVISSADSLFRIYFWDTGMGGTQLYYTNVIQYKSGQKINSVVVDDGVDYKTPAYDTIYTLKRNNKTYYLACYTAKMDLSYYIRGVHVFSIDNDPLNLHTKIIKTKTGLHSKLEYYYYDTFIDRDNVSDDWFGIHYDEKSATLKIPVVLEEGKATGKYIAYKFTGQYFERVKN